MKSPSTTLGPCGSQTPASELIQLPAWVLPAALINYLTRWAVSEVAAQLDAGGCLALTGGVRCYGQLGPQRWPSRAPRGDPCSPAAAGNSHQGDRGPGREPALLWELVRGAPRVPGPGLPQHGASGPLSEG